LRTKICEQLRNDAAMFIFKDTSPEESEYTNQLYQEAVHLSNLL